MAQPIPQLEWLHICDHAFRDEQGKLCLIGMFDALHSRQLPGQLPVFSVAMGLTDGQGEYGCGLEIISPSGKSLDVGLPPIHLAERHAKARAVIRLASLPFEEFGRYTFRLKIRGQPIDYPVHVMDHLPIDGGSESGGPGSEGPAAEGFPGDPGGTSFD